MGIQEFVEQAPFGQVVVIFLLIPTFCFLLGSMWGSSGNGGDR